MYERIRPRLGTPSDTAMLGYPINAEFHLHAHDMIRITVAWVFDNLYPSDCWKADLTLSVDSLLQKHWKPELGALLENVAPDGTALLDLPEGRMVHPGHAIESAWMLMDLAWRDGNAPLMETAIEIALASLEHGWDKEYGGLRYITNLDWTPTHPLEADLKLWWPHCEALYALLLAWAYSGRSDVGQWYEKVHRYSFEHFPDPEFGEWFGYLNRDGSRVWTAKANGWKGFFHLPRVLFRSHQLLAKNT
jgi:N-acylglucosamine 2-epimerase